MDYVLYVGYDVRDATRFCPGSRRAIELIDEAGAQERVTVQSVDALRKSMTALPEWTKGHHAGLPADTEGHEARGAGAPGDELTQKASQFAGHRRARLDGMAPGEAMHLGAEANRLLEKDDRQSTTTLAR